MTDPSFQADEQAVGSRCEREQVVSNQPDLPGLDAVSPMFELDAVADPHGKLRGYTLFLAILPSAEDAERIHQIAGSLSIRCGVVGPRVAANRLHITLHQIAGYRSGITRVDVDAAAAAAVSVVCAPFTVAFDKAVHFKNSDEFVLRCDAASDAAVAQLRGMLQVDLRRAGLHPEPSDTPHMTIAYDCDRPPAEHGIEPVRWHATRFALIVSHIGLGHHQLVHPWAPKAVARGRDLHASNGK